MEQAQAGALLRPMRPESLLRGRLALGASEARTADGAGASQEMARESAQTEAQGIAAPVMMHRLAGLAPFAPRVTGRSGAAAQAGGEAAQAQLPTQEPPSSPSSFTSPLACNIEIPLPLSPLPDAPKPADQAALVSAEADAQALTMPDPLAGLELLAPDLLDDPEDDWPDENEQDAVPTAQMPLPACVPLFDLSNAPRVRRKWPWVVGGIGAALALGGALAWYFGRHPTLP